LKDTGTLGQCVSARQRWSAVRKLYHDDNQSARTKDDVSFCIGPPPLDPVCSLPSLQLLEPVTSFEVSKLLSIIPLKSCCLDYIPTAIIKMCSLYSLTSLLTWPSCPSVRALFRPSLSTLLLLHFYNSQAWIHLFVLIFDLSLTSITSPKFLKGFFLHVCNHILRSHLTSIFFSQPIANTTLLKPL